MANREKDQEDIQRGRMATVTEAVVKPFVQERVEKIIQKLVFQYRSGGLTDEMMIGSIGEITGLKDLLNELENDQRIGIGAMEREFKDA